MGCWRVKFRAWGHTRRWRMSDSQKWNCEASRNTRPRSHQLPSSSSSWNCAKLYSQVVVETVRVNLPTPAVCGRRRKLGSVELWKIWTLRCRFNYLSRNRPSHTLNEIQMVQKAHRVKRALLQPSPLAIAFPAPKVTSHAGFLGILIITYYYK